MGTLHECFFSAKLTGNQFKFVIDKVGYSGDRKNIDIAQLEIIQNGEDILTPIRSTEMNVSVIASEISSDDFYSDIDYQFTGILTQLTDGGIYAEKTIFRGFLQYSESSVPFNDLPNNINLTFTCGIGELQNIKLIDAFADEGYLIGDKISLSQIVLSCLKKMKHLVTEFNLYANFFSNDMLDRSSGVHDFMECVINTGLWDEETTAYECLETIMRSFQCSIHRSLGEFCITRAADKYLAFSPSQEMGTNIDSLGFRSNADKLPDAYRLGPNGDMRVLENDGIQTNVRAIKEVKNNFNYLYPSKTIFNLDLQELGTLRTSYSASGNTVYEYEATGFFPNPTLTVPTQMDYWIEVVEDSLGVEIERYLVVESNIGASIQDAVNTTGYYINKGDTVQININLRTFDNDTSGARTTFIYAVLDDPINTPDRSVNYGLTSGEIDGSWGNFGPSAIKVQYLNGEDSGEYKNISIETKGAPIDGYLSFVLGATDLGGGKTYYKDLKATVTARYNDSNKIIGQTSTRTFTEDRAQVIANDFQIDSVKKNAVSGALLTNDLSTNTSRRPGTPFLDYITLTSFFHRQELVEDLYLNELFTLDEARFRATKRWKVEATFEAKKIVSLLDYFKFSFYRDNLFLPVYINHDILNGTFHAEMQDIGYPDEVVINDYEYKLNYE